MQLSNDPVQAMHDHATATHWMNAVGDDARQLFTFPQYDNVLQFAIGQDVWFVPDYASDGKHIIPNARLESFRLAYLHDVLSNLLDIATHLDDDPTDSNLALERLMAQDYDEHGNASWITTPHPFSVVHKTMRLR